MEGQAFRALVDQETGRPCVVFTDADALPAGPARGALWASVLSPESQLWNVEVLAQGGSFGVHEAVAQFMASERGEQHRALAARRGWAVVFALTNGEPTDPEERAAELAHRRKQAFKRRRAARAAAQATSAPDPDPAA